MIALIGLAIDFLIIIPTTQALQFFEFWGIGLFISLILWGAGIFATIIIPLTLITATP